MKVNERVASIGSVFTALLASACCIGPLAFVFLGIGGLGFATIFEPYRPIFVSLTVVFLGIGFYFNYRKPDLGEGEECCEPLQVQRQRKINRIFLWSATVLAAFLITLQYFLPFIY
jgi:mercuric ion transport protein